MTLPLKNRPARWTKASKILNEIMTSDLSLDSLKTIKSTAEFLIKKKEDTEKQARVKGACQVLNGEKKA